MAASILNLDATAQLMALEARRISAAELLDLSVARWKSQHARINAVVETDLDRARAKARIIDARRHPLGSGFSAFKQHFAQGQSFSYDLGDIGRYYRDYVAWMDHVDAVLPGRVHRVIYEDLVQDTEAEVGRLLAYCDLPFEEACLRFHENSRAVRTVSSEQVRRPIFRDGLDQWRAFEPWLDPMKAALGPALAGWRGAAVSLRQP